MVRGGDTVMAGIVCIFRSVGTSVLSDNIQELEGGLDDVKAMCQTTKKHLLACLSGNVGSDFERRLVCTHVNTTIIIMCTRNSAVIERLRNASCY